MVLPRVHGQSRPAGMTERIMRVVQKKAAATLLVSLAMVTGISGSALARTPYDGVWSVVVAAEAGTCSGAYRYPIAIVNGYVRQVGPGDPSFDIQGRVGRGGRVSVDVSRGAERAHGVAGCRRSRVAARGDRRPAVPGAGKRTGATDPSPSIEPDCLADVGNEPPHVSPFATFTQGNEHHLLGFRVSLHRRTLARALQGRPARIPA